jgi:hypothetical protein
VALAPLSFSVDELAGTVSQGSPEGLRGNRWADGFEARSDFRMEQARHGVRRQSGSGDGAFGRTTMMERSTRLVRAKAVSRCACHRSPRQPRRGDIFVESVMKMNSSSVRSGICRPDGAGELGGAGGYKDFTPDGAFGRSATVSAGPVAAGGWAEGVKNILRRGFANVLRLGFAPAALLPQRGCSIQPSVGAKRLRWVNGQNENNSEGVAAGRRWI